MTGEPDRSTRIANLTSAKPPTAQLRHIWPAIAVLAVIIGGLAGYVWWSRSHDQQVAETVGDASLGKPDPTECAIGRVVLASVHGSGDDARWQAAVGAAAMTLKPTSRVVNPVDVAGFSDEEADNLRAKIPADWRWCAGMGAFVRSLNWSPLGGDADTALLALSRPATNTAGNEAKVYVTFSAPRADDDGDAPRKKVGPWLVTLHPDAGAVWRLTATVDLSRR